MGFDGDVGSTGIVGEKVKTQLQKSKLTHKVSLQGMMGDVGDTGMDGDMGGSGSVGDKVTSDDNSLAL